jgi:cytochrome c oxidase subunit 3
MIMSAQSADSKRLHPHKFTLWVGIGSIIMMFAALTSAYVVRHAQQNWLEFDLPRVFWYSTAVIIASSITMQLSLKDFKAHSRVRYRLFLGITALLGVLFAVLQIFGFYNLYSRGIQIVGEGSNPSASFLGIITGLHVVHVLGGVIALLIIYIKAYSKRIKTYNSIPLEILSVYWHFVDILWIYLFIFLNLAR